MENNRDLLLTMAYQRTMFAVQANFTSWDIMFTRFSDFYLYWTQMTFDRRENQQKLCLHTKFEVQATFTSCDIVFTKFSYFDLCWPQMTFDLHEKQ